MRRIRKWFGRGDRDYAEEILAHIEAEAAENEARGMDPAAARAAARRAFGNPASVRETLREARPAYWFDTLAQDIRYGVRLLRRSPLLGLTVLLTLTFGIGICSTIFTILNAELFRPKVDRDPAAFVRVIPVYTAADARRIDPGHATLDDYRALRAAAPPADLAGWERVPAALDGVEAPQFDSLLVTCNFFRVWGLDHPRIGRLFRDEECAAPGGEPVAVISEEFWRARFATDPGILGRTISVNKQLLTVVGVVPERWPGRTYRNTEVWIPYTMQPRFGGNARLSGGGPMDRFREPATPWLEVAGRLNPGTTRSGVQAALNVVAGRRTGVRFVVTDGSAFGNPFERASVMWAAGLVLGLLTLVLIIVCTNVTILLLSRAAARRREIAVRLSLGAGWFRLVRMLLTESLLLAGVAGAISAWMAWRLPDPIRTFVANEPANYSMAPDWRSFLYLGCITLFAGCLAGLAPALESLRLDLARALKDGGMFRRHVRSRGRSLLVGAQVATSVLVLVLAWIMVRGHLVHRVAPDFDVDRVMSRWLRLDEPHTPETAAALYRVLEARVRAVPGITAFALADGVKQSDLTSIRVPGQAPRPVTARSVSTEYFQALGIPIVAGRALAPGESGVAVISEHLARGLWPGESALGKTMDDPDRGTLLVVGIAKTLPESYFNGTPLQLYRPFHARARSREMVIRFEGDTRSSIRGVSAALRDVFPGVVPAPETLRAQVDAAAHEFRVVAGLLFAVGVVIILLAVIGIYGVIAFSVRQRARELGIRVALGARSLEIVRLLCVSGMRPVWIGLAAGLALAIAGAQVVEQAFSGSGIPMHAGDPLAYLGGGLLIVGASAAAMAGPAFRAAHTDPVEALRHD